MTEFQKQLRVWREHHLKDAQCAVCQAPSDRMRSLERPLMMDELDPDAHRVVRGRGQDFAVIICAECGHSLFVNTDQMKPF